LLRQEASKKTPKDPTQQRRRKTVHPSKGQNTKISQPVKNQKDPGRRRRRRRRRNQRTMDQISSRYAVGPKMTWARREALSMMLITISRRNI
jgi:hypothetical protein